MLSVISFNQMDSHRQGLIRGFGIADIVGLLVLAGLMVPISMLFRGTAYMVWLWALGYPSLAGCCLFAWLGDKVSTEPSKNLMLAVGSVFCGSVSFGIDVIATSIMHPKLPFSQAIWHAGSPFGIVLTLFLCPALTMFYLAGAARAKILRGNARYEPT
jgi:hypothetical protein